MNPQQQQQQQQQPDPATAQQSISSLDSSPPAMSVSSASRNGNEGRGRSRSSGRGRGRPAPSSLHPATANGGLSEQQLRQRRARILRDKFAEQNELKQIRDITQKSNQRRRHYMTKLYMVVFTAFVVTLVSLQYHRTAKYRNRLSSSSSSQSSSSSSKWSSWFYNNVKSWTRKPPPPLYMGTLYPPDVIMERDLPRFFRTYSIATPKNLPAREAVIKVANSRKALRHGTGNIKVILKAWDVSNIDLLLQRNNICGRDFERAYHDVTTSLQRQNDLIMWCLLANRIVDGFFLGSVEMFSNAFILSRKRGMMVQVQQDHSERISNAYYLHPRLPGEEDNPMAPLPAMVVSWLLANPEDSLYDDPQGALQEYIHELLESQFADNRDQYMMLHEVCQSEELLPPPPPRAIGRHCRQSEVSEGGCCYFVVPESEGGDIEVFV